RKDDHSYRIGAAGEAFVPCDKDGPVVGKRGGIEDWGQLLGEPVVALARRAGAAGGEIVHVVGEVGRDKIVSTDVAGGEVAREVGIGADMVRAVGVIRSDVIKESERIVPSDIFADGGIRAGGTGRQVLHV